MHEMIEKITALQPVVWNNPKKKTAHSVLADFSVKMEDIVDAERRLQRFPPPLKPGTELLNPPFKNFRR